MKRLAWLTDIHLNFVREDKIKEFCNRILESGADAVLVGGDIGEAPSVVRYLKILEEELQCPIYFVLGNHDFYYGSIDRICKAVRDMTGNSKWLHWLTGEKVIELTDRTCLVGDGLWADGRLGDYEHSGVFLSDYVLIEELVHLDKEILLGLLKELGDQGAERLREGLTVALEKYHNIIVLNHVPPFREACWYDGRISDDDWLPHFSCKAAGECLEELMRKFPDRQMTVLCGHTHGSGDTRILPNLHVKTGGAKYGEPEIADILVIE
jgi:predicted phosphohydrolase